MYPMEMLTDVSQTCTHKVVTNSTNCDSKDLEASEDSSIRGKLATCCHLLTRLGRA